MKKILGVIIVMALIVVTGGIAFSASTVQPVDVTANLLGQCAVATTNMDFGDVLGNGDIKSSNLSVNCTSGLPYAIGIGDGLQPLGVMHRQMADTATQTALLQYEVCKDNACGSEWGTVGGFQLAGTGTGAAEIIPVYAQFNNINTVGPGAYSDTVQVTVSY